MGFRGRDLLIKDQQVVSFSLLVCCCSQEISQMTSSDSTCFHVTARVHQLKSVIYYNTGGCSSSATHRLCCPERLQASGQVEPHAAFHLDNAFQSTRRETLLTVTSQASVPDTMEGSASQRCTLRQRRMERCRERAREREGETLEHVVEEVNK